MGFDKAPSSEAPKASMTQEEWEKFANKKVNDPELAAWMAEKGLEFDKGLVSVQINGKVEQMNTARDDFGTTLKEAA